MSEPAMVGRRGRVFRFGDYPGQRFSLTPEEFAAANGDLTQVPLGIDPIGLAHYHGKTSILDGETGHAAGFSVQDGSIVADFQVPDWLNRVIDRSALKMSAVFDVATKRLLQIDFTDRPIIPDAALFAEGSTVAIFAGESLMEDDDGDGDDEGEEETTSEELAQQMHEIIADGFPAVCDAAHGMRTAGFCEGAGKPHHLIALHDFTLHHGAQCSGSHHAGFAQEDYPVAEEQYDDPQVDVAEFAQMKADMRAVLEENARIKADNAKIKAQKISADAAGFAREYADRVPPPAQPLFAGLFEALATADDEAPGVVGFSFGKDGSEKFSGSRVDLLRQAVASLKPHQIGGQRTVNAPIGEPPSTAGFAHHPGEDHADPNVITDARKAQLLKLAGR